MDATLFGPGETFPEPNAEELREELEGLLLRHPQRFLLLSFEQEPLEATYRLWHRAIYHRELRVGLLLATFLYFICTIAFSSWSHLQQYGGAAAETSPSVATQTVQLALEAGVMAILSLSFGFSFTSCAARMPRTFAAMVLLLATSFVTVRSALLNVDGDGVFSSPVWRCQRAGPGYHALAKPRSCSPFYFHSTLGRDAGSMCWQWTRGAPHGTGGCAHAPPSCAVMLSLPSILPFCRCC